jgi:hypothetical protein
MTSNDSLTIPLYNKDLKGYRLKNKTAMDSPYYDPAVGNGSITDWSWKPKGVDEFGQLNRPSKAKFFARGFTLLPPLESSL